MTEIEQAIVELAPKGKKRIIFEVDEGLEVPYVELERLGFVRRPICTSTPFNKKWETYEPGFGNTDNPTAPSD